MIIGVLGGNEISMFVSFATSPAMTRGMTWGDDRREKRDSSIPIDAFAGIDGGLFSLVDIALIVRGCEDVVEHGDEEFGS